jgi:DNA-binding LacI/PurR family transcriptional regulator
VFTPGASVSEETRKKVLKAASSLGYRPNALARSLIAGRSRIIGVLVSYLSNQFYPEVLETLSQRLQALGFHLLLFIVDEENSADPLLQQAMDYQVDGLIMASVSLSSKLAAEAVAAGIPVVMFNRTSDISEASSVTGENFAGSACIASFFVAAGHKKIALIAGQENTSTNRDRESGFRTRLGQLGVTLARREVGAYSFTQAAEAARRLFGEGERPDAIFCANDHMAIAAIEVARNEFGLDVPGDVSIAGFDDIGPARWPSYAITSFQQPIDRMVDACISILLGSVIDNSPVVRHIVVPGELIVRASARVPPGTTEKDEQKIWRDSVKMPEMASGPARGKAKKER